MRLPTQSMADAATFCMWPEGAFGLSSGWHHGPVSRRPLSVRQPVWLKPREARFSPAGTNDPAPPIPMLVKTPEPDMPGAVPGLSSGAASALVRRNGRVYKIKRCGFQDGADRQGELGTYMLKSSDIDTRETAGIEKRVLGWMSVAAARREAAGLAAFAAAGLPVAYTPVGTYVWADALEPDDEKGALACDIASDLRGDELFFMILTPRFARFAETGQLWFRARTGRIDFADAVIDGAFVDIEIGRTGQRLESLGCALGGALRRLHDAGLLRGHLNAWFGNDVIAPDGWICPVDCDGATDIARHLPPHKIARMQQLERVEYSNLLFTELIHFQSLVIAEAGRRLRDAVDRGYEARSKPKLAQGMLDGILDDFVAARPALDIDEATAGEDDDARRNP